MCPLIGATANSTNEALPSNGQGCFPPRNLHMDFDRISINDRFSFWARQNRYDPIFLKPQKTVATEEEQPSKTV